MGTISKPIDDLPGIIISNVGVNNSDNIAVVIQDEDYIDRKIEETQKEIDEKENQIFDLEKRLLILNAHKRQHKKKNALYIENIRSTSRPG